MQVTTAKALDLAQQRRKFRYFVGFWSFLFFVVLLISAVNVMADDDDEDEDKPKIPDPEEVDLVTRDGLLLKATFYPSWLGKQAVPIVVLHELKSDRSKYRDMALYLQSKGHAVMVPDLRGHGGSTDFQPERRLRPLDANRLSGDDYANMVKYDVEKCKSFLMDLNNKELLNIEKLCIVGVEMGAVIGTHFAYSDWTWQQLPNLKQGQDVKALVMISPPLNFRGMALAEKMTQDRRATVRQNYAASIIASKMSMMVLYGEQDSVAKRNADKLESMLRRNRPDVPKEERQKKETVFVFGKATKLQGDQLIGEPKFQVAQFINGFVTARLKNKPFPWTDRTPP